MSYSTSNPPIKIGGSIGAGGTLWLYKSDTAHGDADAPDFFENGYELGMRVGDPVIVVETDNSYALSLHVVTACAAGGAATISARVTS